MHQPVLTNQNPELNGATFMTHSSMFSFQISARLLTRIYDRCWSSRVLYYSSAILLLFTGLLSCFYWCCGTICMSNVQFHLLPGFFSQLGPLSLFALGMRWKCLRSLCLTKTHTIINQPAKKYISFFQLLGITDECAAGIPCWNWAGVKEKGERRPLTAVRIYCLWEQTVASPTLEEGGRWGAHVPPGSRETCTRNVQLSQKEQITIGPLIWNRSEKPQPPDVIGWSNKIRRN